MVVKYEGEIVIQSFRINITIRLDSLTLIKAAKILGLYCAEARMMDVFYPH